MMIMDTVNRDRYRVLSPFSFGCALVVVGSLILVNLHPRVRWGHINYYLIDGEFAHGWPAHRCHDHGNRIIPART